MTREIPDWLREKNILIRDLWLFLFWLLAKSFMIFNIIIYPLLCMFFNKDEILKAIKEMWRF